MKVVFENIVKARPMSLRQFAESEIISKVYCGFDRNEEDAKLDGNRVGIIYDMQSLFQDLSKLLKKYADIEIEQRDNVLILSGQPKTYGNNVEVVEKLEVVYNSDEKYILIKEDELLGAYCNQLEFLDNLAGQMIFKILIWIQNDETLKKCYIEFLELIDPYQTKLRLQKNEFMKTLMGEIIDCLDKLPQEKVDIMPVTLNVPLLAFRLQQELDSYNLQDSDYYYNTHSMNVFIRDKDIRLKISIDTRTMNGIIVLPIVAKKIRVELLGAESLKEMVRIIASQLQEVENIYCRLFANKMIEVLYELVYWYEDDIPEDNQTKYERLFRN